MENTNKSNRSIWIVVGIIILVAIFYFAGKNYNAQTQSTINNTTDKSQACAGSSKDLYNSLVNKYISQNNKGDVGYENHFNTTLGKCFMLETWRGTGLNLGITEYRIWDVFDNTKLAEVESISGPNYNFCSINGVLDCTQQFSDFVNTRMENNLNY